MWNNFRVENSKIQVLKRGNKDKTLKTLLKPLKSNCLDVDEIWTLVVKLSAESKKEGPELCINS